jgi:predicted dehydrogenase
VSVVGCGFISSKWHIPAFLRLNKKVTIQAVCDINPELAASVAKNFNIPRFYSNTSEMLQKENLDMVDICTPPSTHSLLAIEAMEHGCHVLLEKPMALKLSDCDQMVGVSQKQNVKLCVVHNELFRPPLIKARKLVEEGAIGKLLGMYWCRFTHKDEYLTRENHWIHRLPGGLLGEVGPHAVYTSLAFLKKINNVDITAKNNLKYPWAPFDYFSITLEGEGSVSSVIISHASSNYIADINVFGTEEMLRLDLQNMLLTRHRLSKTKPVPLALSSLKAAGQMIGNVFSNAARLVLKRDAIMRVIGHATEIEQFVDSVVNDKQPPVTGEEGRETIRVMELLVQKFNQKYSSSGNQGN